MAASNEYSGINTSSANFVGDLTALINPHDDQFYSTYAPTMIYLFQTRDTFAVVGANTFSKVITCAYSREEKLYNEPFDWTGTGYSREHSYAHTWMPSYPADSPEKPEYNDQHNLYPTRQTNVNALRCNYPFGEVVTPQTTFLEGVLGLDANGQKVYEPSDKQKGKTARALMYMATCYNGISGNNWAFTDSIGNCSGNPINYGQDQNILKKWHYDFPPDNFDMARNDFLDSLQENRNPFVDRPEYACFIDFSNMTKINDPVIPCNTIGVNEEDKTFSKFLLLPNPAAEQITLTSASLQSGMIELNILDVTGKVVLHEQLNVLAGNNKWVFNINQLNKGVYFVRVSNGNNLLNEKLIKQ
jgi:endonuclease I